MWIDGLHAKRVQNYGFYVLCCAVRWFGCLLADTKCSMWRLLVCNQKQMMFFIESKKENGSNVIHMRHTHSAMLQLYRIKFHWCLDRISYSFMSIFCGITLCWEQFKSHGSLGCCFFFGFLCWMHTRRSKIDTKTAKCVDNTMATRKCFLYCKICMCQSCNLICWLFSRVSLCYCHCTLSRVAFFFVVRFPFLPLF